MTEADQWMSGAGDYRGRLTEKQHEGTFRGDGNVLNIVVWLYRCTHFPKFKMGTVYGV